MTGETKAILSSLENVEITFAEVLKWVKTVTSSGKVNVYACFRQQLSIGFAADRHRCVSSLFDVEKAIVLGVLLICVCTPTQSY